MSAFQSPLRLGVGPFLPLRYLQAYEATIPGAAERIFANFEAESEHRRQLERETSRRDSFRSNMGLVAGYCIALVIITVAVVAIFRGYSWQGVTILGTGLATDGFYIRYRIEINIS